MCKWGADEKDQEGKWTNTGKPYNSGTNPADSQDAYFWHAFDLLMVIKITLAVVFVFALQYTPHIKFTIILVMILRSSDSMFFQVYTSLLPTVLKVIPRMLIVLSLSQKVVLRLWPQSQSPELKISIAGGTIKNKDNNLQTNSPLNENDVLSLNASGTLSGGDVSASGNVNLEGTIVVTSINQAIGSPLTFGGGPKKETANATFYHAFDLLIVIKISLASIFIYSLHYGESHIVDITKIIITGITDILKSPNPEKATEAPITGNVTINYGTVTHYSGSQARIDPDTTKNATIGTATTATITPATDGKTATLEITIDITKITSPNADALAALADLAIPIGPCKVNVKSDKITIKITFDEKDAYASKKWIDIEITGALTNLATALNLNGTTTDKATVRVDPAPNHLTITYNTTGFSVTKDAALKIPEAMEGQGMTAVTKATAQKIVEQLKKTAPPGTDAKNYYSVTDPKTKIRYSFTLNKDQAEKLNDGADAKIIVQYDHIFAEKFDTSSAFSEILREPPVIVALLNKGDLGDDARNYSPKTNFVWHGNEKTGLQGWLPYPATHVKDEEQSKQQGKEVCNESKENTPYNLVHAWIWHFFEYHGSYYDLPGSNYIHIFTPLYRIT
ncbi:uncharacterized protein TA03845 [Theileria annulata]|uniref:Uncharacterized protein n=1 Tax=Theileria annulata TaxID=5874 RepID=Q4UCD4_THEAN|nr:uncharacterized protein TA03845 [Theileria annulata]CAI75517.1 hypothetical protein, conserved [Theileria annulata]|eukprot:XP_954993.1 hypothetical protein, conserved [Theileria annulata]